MNTRTRGRALVRALFGIAFALALSACESATAQEEDGWKTPQAVHTYSGGATEDTVYAAALVIKFPDGNTFRFGSSPGTGVTVTGTVSGVSSNLTFTNGGQVIAGGSAFLADNQRLGFFSTWPITQQAVTGDRSAGTALTNLLSTLNAYGLVTNLTVP